MTGRAFLCKLFFEAKVHLQRVGAVFTYRPKLFSYYENQNKEGHRIFVQVKRFTPHAMKFFLRFTATPALDLERGTSYHETPWDEDERTIEEVAEACDCPVDSIELFDFRGRGVNTYMQALGGLCGFELEAESLEDALEEVKENWGGKSAVGFSVDDAPWAIFTGANMENTLPDGTVFCPRAVAHQAAVAA